MRLDTAEGYPGAFVEADGAIVASPPVISCPPSRCQMQCTLESISEAHQAPRLWKIQFVEGDRARLSIRGKESGGYPGATGSFQWTPAVKALLMLLLRARLVGRGLLTPDEGLLRGGAGSPAASLDYAIGKQPQWLCELFGVRASGEARARTLFKRLNAERKRGGAVSILLNQAQLAPTEIHFRTDVGATLADNELTELLHRAEAAFFAR